MALKLPFPYPNLEAERWENYQILRNFQFISEKLTAIAEGQLMPSGGIIMVRSGTTCPTGYTKISDAGLPGRFLRLATTGGGTGGASTTVVTSAGGHTHTNSIPTSTRLVTSAASGTTFTVASNTHIHTLSSSGGHTHTATLLPLYLDVILCEKD